MMEKNNIQRSATRHEPITIATVVAVDEGATAEITAKRILVTRNRYTAILNPPRAPGFRDGRMHRPLIAKVTPEVDDGASQTDARDVGGGGGGGGGCRLSITPTPLALLLHPLASLKRYIHIQI